VFRSHGGSGRSKLELCARQFCEGLGKGCRGGGVTSRCRETSTLEANKIVKGVNRLGVNADRHEARDAPEGYRRYLDETIDLRML